MRDDPRRSVASHRSRRGLRAKLGLVAASVVGSVLLAEVGLRVVGLEGGASLHTPDRRRGWAYRPGAVGYYVAEGRSPVEVNSEGANDRDHTLEKPPKTLRIAVLGDSFTAALELPRTHAFWAVLERRLASCDAFAGLAIEVLSYGVGGYGTAQEIVTFREHARRYAPDVVILQFFSGNDVMNNHRALSPNGGPPPSTPYFVFRDGALVLDASFADDPVYDVDRVSRYNTWGEVQNRSSFLRAGVKAWSKLGQLSASPRPAGPNAANELEQGLSGPDVYRAPRSEVGEEAWRATLGMMSLLDGEVRAAGAELWVITATTPTQVYPDPEKRRTLMAEAGSTDLFYAEHRLRAYGLDKGIRIVVPGPEMAEHADLHRVFLHGFGKGIGTGHWNEAGHLLAGEILTRALCEGRGGRLAEEAQPR